MADTPDPRGVSCSPGTFNYDGTNFKPIPDRGTGRVARPFGFAPTDPSVRLSRTRLLHRSGGSVTSGIAFLLKPWCGERQSVEQRLVLLPRQLAFVTTA